MLLLTVISIHLFCLAIIMQPSPGLFRPVVRSDVEDSILIPRERRWVPPRRESRRPPPPESHRPGRRVPGLRARFRRRSRRGIRRRSGTEQDWTGGMAPPRSFFFRVDPGRVPLSKMFGAMRWNRRGSLPGARTTTTTTTTTRRLRLPGYEPNPPVYRHTFWARVGSTVLRSSIHSPPNYRSLFRQQPPAKANK